MFRRFRRNKDKQPETAYPPIGAPFMLPEPERKPQPERRFMPDYDDNSPTPTMPLPSVRSTPRATADDWLVSESAGPSSSTLNRQFTPQPTAKFHDALPPSPQRTRTQSVPIPPVMPVDPEQVAQALEQYLNAADWAASQAIVEDHPELLTNTALMLLRTNMSRVAEQVGPGAAQILSRYLLALETAQREGIAFAFDRINSPVETPLAPDLEDLLARLESPLVTQNLLERVRLCEEALPLAARDQNDELWAALQRELGLTLPRITVGDHAQHIERAIEALDAALQIFTKHESPSDWAMTEHYLGMAFLARDYGTRADNIDQAIDAFEAALEVRTRESLPSDWATTQEALGSAYFHRLGENRSDNVDRSIASFEAALLVRTREKSPFEWATDQLSLGNAYGQRLSGSRLGNIEQAITGFEAALTYFTREHTPGQWALIHHNLGVAYMDRLFGKRADNIDRAIEHYGLAMQIQTRERAPLEWADTLNNLGNALRERMNGDRDENRRRAIATYQDALRVRTRDAFLAEHRRTARNLGTLLFEMGRWGEAHDMLASALAASEMLYALELGDRAPSQRLRDHAELIALDTFCLVKLNRPRDAVQRLENGRARALDEMLERDRLSLVAVPATARLAFEHAQAQLLAAYGSAQRIIAGGGIIAPENLRFSEDDQVSTQRRDLDDLVAQRRDAQTAFDVAVAAIRKTRGDFLHPPILFKQIAAAAAKGQALVYLMTTPQGTLALLIPAGATAVSEEQILWITSLTSARLDDLAPRATDDEYVIKTQLGHLPRPKVLDRLLQAMGEEVMAPLAQRLHAQGVVSVALVPTGRLATIPLQAAPIGTAAPTRDDEGAEQGAIADDTLFMDAFEVTVAPSAQRLMLTRAGSVISLKSGVAAVGNPQPATMALEWSEHEAEAVAQVTNRAGQSCTLLIRRQATTEAVMKAIKERAYIHLACASGFYPERPLESYLELAGGDVLKLADVLGGKVMLRGVRVLVLSAGQSAVSNANAPDESIGMAAAMLVGGASSVVASLWPASDLATLLLMRRFAHNYLISDQLPAQALRNAQRWLRTLTLDVMMRDHASEIARDPDLNLADFTLPQDCPFTHPFFWAGFALHGV